MFCFCVYLLSFIILLNQIFFFPNHRSRVFPFLHPFLSLCLSENVRNSQVLNFSNHPCCFFSLPFFLFIFLSPSEVEANFFSLAVFFLSIAGDPIRSLRWTGRRESRSLIQTKCFLSSTAVREGGESRLVSSSASSSLLVCCLWAPACHLRVLLVLDPPRWSLGVLALPCWSLSGPRWSSLVLGGPPRWFLLLLAGPHSSSLVLCGPRSSSPGPQWSLLLLVGSCSSFLVLAPPQWSLLLLTGARWSLLLLAWSSMGRYSLLFVGPCSSSLVLGGPCSSSFVTPPPRWSSLVLAGPCWTLPPPHWSLLVLAAPCFLLVRPSLSSISFAGPPSSSLILADPRSLPRPERPIRFSSLTPLHCVTSISLT